MQFTRINRDGDMLRLDLKPTKVDIGGMFGPLDAYIRTDETWNGFVIPYFTHEQADAWMKAQLAVLEGAEDVRVAYDAAKDEYTVEADCIDETTAKGCLWLDVEGKKLVHLYCIGGWSWIWEEVEEEEVPSA